MAAENFNVHESTIRDRLKFGKDYNLHMDRKDTFTKIKIKEKETVVFITIKGNKFYRIPQ